MALLSDLCVLAVRNGVENGTIPHVYLLPPMLRQRVLTAVLEHDTINEPSCLNALSSPNFLRGLSSLNLQHRSCMSFYDSNYFLRVMEAMSTTVEGGGTIGSNLSTLMLNLYGMGVWRPYVSERTAAVQTRPSIVAMNFHDAIQLFSKCPNLSSLGLQLQHLTSESNRIDDDDGRWDIFSRDCRGGLLNDTDIIRPCVRVMENLDELSLVGLGGQTAPFLTSQCSIIQFKHLTALRLTDGRVDVGAWRSLLLPLQGTLKLLCLENVWPSDWAKLGDEDWILPLPLPHLTTFTVDRYPVLCSKRFVDNLLQCSNLKYLFLQVAARLEDEESLIRLGSISVELEVKIAPPQLGFLDEKVISKMEKWVTIFDAKITSFEFSGAAFRRWSPEATKLLQSISQCRNLVSLEYKASADCEFSAPLETQRELRAAKMAFAPLFRDQERALKLRKLSLYGHYDHDVLASVFRNCVNLDHLDVYFCPELSDDHLIEWSARGARPSRLTIRDCRNVSDDGLIPLLIACRGRRMEIGVVDCRKVTWRSWRVARSLLQEFRVDWGREMLFE